MSGEFVLAIDQGTTNTKALLVGRDGQPAFRASVPVSIRSPQPGWVEQDAIELWESVVNAVAQCLTWTTERGSWHGIALQASLSRPPSYGSVGGRQLSATS